MNRLATILAVLVVVSAGSVAARGANVCLIRVDGPIGPATSDYIARAVEAAKSQNAQCLILELNTPGGLLESTKTIVTSLLNSPVPTVVYVAPSGATAASAGCFITLSGDVAAMAPATTIGAAHPVQLGGQGSSDDTMQQKIESYSISYIETIAQRRNRNVEWARSAVKDSASITADRALELKVIEIIAADVPDLLAQLDGREINGRVLSTAEASITEIAMAFRERVFQMIWRPEVMFILMLVAIYGLIGELSNPGAIIPGVAGAIALILLLYMAAVLPINIAGLALIGLALALLLADIFAPTHGVLTAGGIAAFFLGSIMLFDHPEPAFRLSLAFIIPATLLTAMFFMFVVGAGLRAQWIPVKVGRETIVGQIAVATTGIDRQSGKVSLEGEYWNALSDVPIAAGTPVQVIALEGLTLKVEPKPPARG